MLDAVERIPPGSVASYGDLAELVGVGSARWVGQVMARWGHEVPWHRVVMADGSPAPHKTSEQLGRLRAEGVPLAPGGDRVDMRRARWGGRRTRPADRRRGVRAAR